MIEPKTATPIPELHPLQAVRANSRCSPLVPKAIALAAYEVYCHCYGPQEALITGGRRGGLGMGEIIAFLYARYFPQARWKDKVKEAFDGMQNFGV